MVKPEFLSPSDQTTTIGHAFGTPLVIKGLSWLPAIQVFWWGLMSWIAGRRHPDWPLGKRLLDGFGMMVAMLGSEWCHNLSHAAAARWIGRPMDALRIFLGMPLVIYYDPENAAVTPRQHLVRSLGGPAFNVTAFSLASLLRRLTAPDTVARDVVDAAVGMNAFIFSVGMLPIPGIDGGPITKWSLVELGQTPPQADETVKKINRVTGAGLGLAAGVALKKRHWLLGMGFGLFSILSLLIGFGLLREK